MRWATVAPYAAAAALALDASRARVIKTLPAAVTTLQIVDTPEADLLPEPVSYPIVAQRKLFNENGYLVVDDMCEAASLPPPVVLVAFWL